MKTIILVSVVPIMVLTLGQYLANAIYDGTDATPNSGGVLTYYAVITLKDQPLWLASRQCSHQGAEASQLLLGFGLVSSGGLARDCS